MASWAHLHPSAGSEDGYSLWPGLGGQAGSSKAQDGSRLEAESASLKRLGWDQPSPPPHLSLSAQAGTHTQMEKSSAESTPEGAEPALARLKTHQISALPCRRAPKGEVLRQGKKVSLPQPHSLSEPCSAISWGDKQRVHPSRGPQAHNTTALLTFVLGVGKVSFLCLLSVNEKRPEPEPMTGEGKCTGGGRQRPAWALPGEGLGDRYP